MYTTVPCTWVICSDSKAALNYLQEPYAKNLNFKMLKQIIECATSSKHSGFHGNDETEKLDNSAYEGLADTFLPLTAAGMKDRARRTDFLYNRLSQETRYDSNARHPIVQGWPLHSISKQQLQDATSRNVISSLTAGCDVQRKIPRSCRGSKLSML